jgi:Ribonuclease G/E
MSRKLFFDVAPGERRGVVALDGQPERLLIERDGEAARPRLGEVWRGRVGAAAPGFRGFFVDLGCGPAGLLAAEAGARPAEGAVLEAEITAEARADKGPLLRRMGAGEGAPGRLKTGPSLEDRLRVFAPGAEIKAGETAREAADLAEAAALAQIHPQPDGLSLAIERTRGMTAVDVDLARAQAGRRTILDANLRAVGAAARLLRLKGLGGLAVIDLAGKASEHLEILAAARAAFEPDQPGVIIAGVSRLGVLEIARPWRETPIAERLLDADGRPTARTVAQRLVRALDRQGRADPGGQYVVACAPEVAGLLEPLARALGPRFGTRVELGRSIADADIQLR